MINEFILWSLRHRISKFDGTNMLALLRLLAVALHGNVVIQGDHSRMEFMQPKKPIRKEAEKAAWN